MSIQPAASPPVVLHFSLGNNGRVDGLSVASEDIIAFDMSFQGSRFSLTFDGSDVGLGSFTIDAFDIITDNEILLSFTGTFSVPGVSGPDEDILEFTPNSLRASTSGVYSLFLDLGSREISSSAHVGSFERMP